MNRLVLALLVLLVLWLIVQQRQKPEPGIGNSSEIGINQMDPEPELSIELPALNKSVPTPPSSGFIIASSDQEWTYLNHYQVWQLAKGCAWIYQTWKTHGETHDFVNHIVSQNTLHEHQAVVLKPAQDRVLQSWLSECQALMNAAGVQIKTSSNPSYDVEQHHWQRLQNTEAVTVAEQQIEQALRLTATWAQSLEALFLKSLGENTLSTSELAELETEILELSALQRAGLDEEAAPEELDAFMSQTLRLESLKLQLQQQKHVDQAVRVPLLAAFLEQSEVLFALLKTDNPHVFQLVLSRLEMSHGHLAMGLQIHKHRLGVTMQNAIPEYVSPGELLSHELGVVPSHHNAYAMQMAAHLYWCELGADCSPSGPVNRVHCLGQGMTGMFPQACELPLADFYREAYLSENQRSDVESGLLLMRGLYAP